jgi:sodium/bile acid cotransporter 3/5
MALPWLGFAFGCMAARLCRRPVEDVIAIAIETGIQNTGVSIFILWFTLDQPAGDLTGNFVLFMFRVVIRLITLGRVFSRF